VTLLLRAGTNVATLDNNGRTPMQLAQSKLKLLQKHSNAGGAEMSKVIISPVFIRQITIKMVELVDF
jgi:hypothetical protein